MSYTYEGPTRHELIHQVLKYNQNHHKVDSILISSASKSADLEAIRQLQKDEDNASDSARLLKKSIKELQELKRHQLKKGPTSSRNDWAWIKLAGKKMVEAAEKGIARHDAKAVGAVAHGHAKRDDQADLSKKVMKPTLLPPAPNQAVPAQKQYRPNSPQLHSTHNPALRPTFPRQEDLSRKAMKPALDITIQKSYCPTSPQPAHKSPARLMSPKQEDPLKRFMKPALEPPTQKPYRPTSPTVKPQDKRLQSPEGKAGQRQIKVEQSENEARLRAKELHSEVRKYWM